MAEQTVLVCDLAHDKSALASTTVELPLKGQPRRVDLCAEHDAQLQSLLAEFLSTVTAGRGPSPRRNRTATKRSSGKRRRNGQPASLSAGQEQIRAWAKEHGLEVSDRGRLSKAVIEQYHGAHQETPDE